MSDEVVLSGFQEYCFHEYFLSKEACLLLPIPRPLTQVGIAKALFQAGYDLGLNQPRPEPVRYPDSVVFIKEFLVLIKYYPCPADNLFLRHACRMDKEIFSVKWKMGVLNALRLRAVAPVGIFVGSTKDLYLTCVKGNNALENIAPAIFSNDIDFLRTLPTDCRQYRWKIAKLIDKGYGLNLRPVDQGVEDHLSGRISIV